MFCFTCLLTPTKRNLNNSTSNCIALGQDYTNVVKACFGLERTVSQSTNNSDVKETNKESSEEYDVKISSFTLLPYLGVGGSGLVRAAKKITGAGKNQGEAS